MRRLTEQEIENYRKYNLPGCASHQRVGFNELHRVELTCEYCKKKFSIHKSRRTHIRNFCSAFCHRKHESELHLKNKIQKKCEICKKEMVVKPSESKKRFCSQKCLSEAWKIRYKGNGNPRWEGGADNYRGEDWKIQRTKAYRRDEGMCQRCGDQPLSLPVHHIIPWRVSKDNKLDNLICLCKRHHMLEENHYRQHKIPSLWLRRHMESKYGVVIKC